LTNKKKEGNGENTFHSHSLNVTGFLGGITFAAMILLMQSKKDIPIPSNFPSFYLEALITATAISSVFFIISSVGMIRVASGEKSEDETFSKAMSVFAGLGFFGLMALLPFMILPFLWEGSLIVAGVEAVTLGIFLKYLLRRRIS